MDLMQPRNKKNFLAKCCPRIAEKHPQARLIFSQLTTCNIEHSHREPDTVWKHTYMEPTFPVYTSLRMVIGLHAKLLRRSCINFVQRRFFLVASFSSWLASKIPWMAPYNTWLAWESKFKFTSSSVESVVPFNNNSVIVIPSRG